MLNLDLEDHNTPPASLTPDKLIIAGWTGRDKGAVEKHIAELELLGVKRPSRTPIFYSGSASRVTCASTIEVLGEQTSGEAEFILLQHDGALWIGIGSDHTDRELESYGVAASKQICDKPIGQNFWRYDRLANHWDDLKIRSYATINGERTLYQDGSVKEMLSPTSLIALYADKGSLPEGTLMFCGTVPVHGGIRPADKFECELEDPVLRRRIGLSYAVTSLPVLS